MIGFADYHAHMFSELAFGEYLFHGDAYPARDAAPEQQLADSLPPCRHGELRHTKTGLSVRFIEGSQPDSGWSHGTQGYPTFADWPEHWTLTHQQMYWTGCTAPIATACVSWWCRSRTAGRCVNISTSGPMRRAAMRP
jgi:hypothetical protein